MLHETPCGYALCIGPLPERHTLQLSSPLYRLCVLHHRGLQTLGILDIHRLHIAVQLLFGTLLIVTLTRDADTEPEGNALDAGFPDLLVQLRVEADV
jgi:hypothetical protein